MGEGSILDFDVGNTGGLFLGLSKTLERGNFGIKNENTKIESQPYQIFMVGGEVTLKFSMNMRIVGIFL